MTPAEKLKAFREKLDVTQAKAAALVGTPTRTWEGWERQGREPPPCLFVLLDYIMKYGPLPPEDMAVK